MPLLTYATASMAASLLAASASHTAAYGWQVARGTLRARNIRGKEQARLRRQAEHARLASELNWQSSSVAHGGWRLLEVIEVVDESVDCRSFYLQDPSGEAMPSFEPGQFVTVRPALGGAGQPTRCYSLSDSPGQPWWRISVKRQTSATVDGRQPHPTGLSDWLHRRIGVGDCLLVNGPCGDFTIDTASDQPIVLMAAGIGITPILSMLKHALQQQPARSIQVFFQAQDDQHWPFGNMIHAWSAQCPSLRVTSFFSRAAALPKTEHGEVVLGRFDASTVVGADEHASQSLFALCGPDAWMKSLTDGLLSQGVSPEQIHSESFGANPPPADQSQQTTAPWSLNFAKSRLDIPTSTQPTTIWQAAKEIGLDLPAVCHSGACGTCRLKLRSGEVRYANQPTCSRASDEVVACIAQPVGDVIVEA